MSVDWTGTQQIGDGCDLLQRPFEFAGFEIRKRCGWHVVGNRDTGIKIAQLLFQDQFKKDAMRFGQVVDDMIPDFLSVAERH